MKNLLTPLLYICVGALLSTMLTRLCKTPQIPLQPQIIMDTVTVVQIDTQYFPKPVPYKVKVRDTVYLQYPQVLVQAVKEYRDSTYYARISGINAFLEEIQVYPKTITKYITITEKMYQNPRKWNLIMDAEYSYMGSKSYLPISLGIKYSVDKSSYFIKGGKDILNRNNFITLGYERNILNW